MPRKSFNDSKVCGTAGRVLGRHIRANIPYIQGEITLGSTVHVHGLTVNTQYNDSIGDVTAIDVCTKQHVVILHADYTKITVKPENLRISQKRVLSLS